MPEYELNLRDYIRIIKKRKFIIFFSCIVFTVASFFYLSSQNPIYEASTTVKIEERKTVAGLLTEWIVYNPGDILETQTKIIKGFPVMKEVAEAMGFINDKTSEEKIYEIVGDLQARVRTERIGQTNIIKIITRSDNRAEAIKLANTVAIEYRKYNLMEKNKQARTAREFIERQLKNLEERLHKSEKKLESFSSEVKNINIAQDVQDKLNDLAFQLASLKQKYTEKHPKVLQLQEQIKHLEDQLKGFSGKELEYARIKREVEVNRKIYAMLREKLEEVRITEAEKVPDVSIVDPASASYSPINVRSRFGLFLGGVLGLIIGMILSVVAETLDMSISSIEDVEKVVKLPILGVVPSVTYEREQPSFHFFHFKKKIIAKSMDKNLRQYIGLISHYKPTSPIAEAFRSIRTNIKLSPSLKTILITSTGPLEGKTTVLLNLGIVCAQEGLKTLLLSTDLRRPSLADLLGIERKPGLSELILGTVTIKEAVRGLVDMILGDLEFNTVLRHPGLDHLYIIPAGSLPLNPMEILDAQEFNSLIINLRKEFDVIFMDSPPVLPVSDANILSSKVDGAILCYEMGRTSRQALLRAKLQLEAAEASILGIILNHTRPQTETLEVFYPYYYKYKYYKRKEE